MNHNVTCLQMYGLLISCEKKWLIKVCCLPVSQGLQIHCTTTAKKKEVHIYESGPEVIKLFSCSTQLSTKFIVLINVKMPTIVGILTFISMIDTASKRLKARNFFICQYFSFMSS